MINQRVSAFLIACFFSGSISAEPFSGDSLVDAPGILPDGNFSFALRVVDNNEALKKFGILSGSLITHVHLISPSRIAHIDGAEGMRETLVELSPGDKAIITAFPPGSTNSIKVDVYLPSLAELRKSRLEQKVREEMADARLRMEAGDAFGASYWGVRLRLFSLGYFDALRFLLNKESETTGEMIDILTGRQAPWLVGLVDLFTKFEGVMSPYQGLISAYGITRVALIGDCSEPVDTMTATQTTWTEYRNGFGHYAGSSGETTTTRDLTVPRGFGTIVSGSGSPDVNTLVEMNLAPIVRSLGCNSVERQLLESNMLAFFRGDPPSYKATVGQLESADGKP